MATPPEVPASTNTPAPEAPALVSLSDLAVGTSVQDRVLQDAGTGFSAAQTPRLYRFNKVTTKAAPTSIRHVWSTDGQTRRHALNVGGFPWSNHAVDPGMWKVEVF